VPRDWWITQYWDQAEVPGDVRGLVTTFEDKNPDLHHRVFSELEAERFIADHLGRRERDAFRMCAVPAMQADYFRYCAVLINGGIWADADLQCIRPLRALLEDCDGGVLFMRPETRKIRGMDARRMENAFFAFKRPGHPFLRMAVELATANVEARIAERVWSPGENVREAIWLTTGQAIFTLMRFVREWGSFDAVRERAVGTIVEPFCDLYCDVIGSYDRILEAFDGVRVAARQEMDAWVANPAGPLAYKATERHWLNSRARIFR
jgi:hypothetical protein